MTHSPAGVEGRRHDLARWLSERSIRVPAVAFGQDRSTGPGSVSDIGWGVLSERAYQLAVCTHGLGQRVTGHKPPEAEVLEQQAGSLDDVLRVLCGDKRLDLLLGAIEARRASWGATSRLEEDRVPPFDSAICYGLVFDLNRSAFLRCGY